MKKILIILTLAFTFTLTAPAALAGDAAADPYGLNTTAINAGLLPQNPEIKLPQRVGLVINYGLVLLGMIFLVLIILGGFEWMTAAGNEDKVKKAKSMIGTAITGILIVFLAAGLAYAITYALSIASS